jgi:hypothetical protein
MRLARPREKMYRLAGGRSRGQVDVVGGAARFGTGRCRRKITGKPNVESGVALVKRLSTRSTLGSVAGLSNVVAGLLMCLHLCISDE